MKIEALVEKVKQGDRRSVARAISLIEDETPYASQLMHLLFPLTGKAYRIGITGPPGAGKSTLTARLIKAFRDQNASVGVVAVDPTSPFSGGAVLGDRIRMSQFSRDPQVFIRSMASRGSMGGLAQKAQDAADVLDAAGKDIIIFETVGVGQTELDIAEAADTTVVVLVPESGDSIQAMKAGLMEIADIFVVNKADREGAKQLKTELEMMLHLRPYLDCERDWNPPVLLTIASQSEGVHEVKEKIEEHRAYLTEHQLLLQKRKQRLAHKIREMIFSELKSRFWNDEREKELEEKIQKVLQHQISPYELVRILMNQTKKSGSV